MSASALAPAVQAFDNVAERFDTRFGEWLSVAAQRDAVRSELLRAFPPGSRILELGGGTGVDAEYLTLHGRTVQLTDPSPAMVRIAAHRLAPTGAPTPCVSTAEDIGSLAQRLGTFDGAFSNFAGLNCVRELQPVAQGLAQLVRPGGRAMLVIFGTVSLGEWIVELVRRRPRNAFRRFSTTDVPARLGGCDFTVRYHRKHDVVRAFAPWFTLAGTKGIGIAVPPSAAEPWISTYPRLVRGLARCDRLIAGPLAFLGDHVMYDLLRTAGTA